MSVKVDLDQLAEALADFTYAYLVTVGDGFRAHTVAVDAVLAAGAFDVGTVGNTTRRNVADHPDVTLVFPPSTPGGYTLIVDGRGDGSVVTPVRAVLHRAAVSNAPTASGCGADCI